MEEEEYSNEFSAEIVFGIIGEKLIKNLEEEVDEALALRKALLFVTFLLQLKSPPAAQNFFDFILNRFPAMQSHIHRSDHPLLNGTNFRVVIDENNQVIVTIPKEFFGEMDQFIEKAAETGDLKREYFVQVQDYFDNQKFKKN